MFWVIREPNKGTSSFHRFVFLFLFRRFRGRRRRRCVEKLILSFKISHRACVIIDTEHHHHHHHRARQSPRASQLTAKQPQNDAQPFFFTPRLFPLFFLKKRWFLRAVVLLLLLLPTSSSSSSTPKRVTCQPPRNFAFFSRKIKEKGAQHTLFINGQQQQQ